jgi:hypothetical protein
MSAWPPDTHGSDSPSQAARSDNSGPEGLDDLASDARLDRAFATDDLAAVLPELPSILARYAEPPEPEPRLSAERCRRLLAQAAARGLIREEQLSFRELLGATLLLPDYVEAAVGAVCDAAARLLRGGRVLAPVPASMHDLAILYARPIPARMASLAAAAALRGPALRPGQAFEAGQISIFITTRHDPRSTDAAPAIAAEAMVARTGSDPGQLAGSRVRLSPPGAPSRSTVLDDFGTFLIDGLSPGTYRLELELEGTLVVVDPLTLAG